MEQNDVRDVIKNLHDQWICCAADSQIRNAVYILRQSGFRTTASCQGTQGHSFSEPTILIMISSQVSFVGWTDLPVKVSECISCLSAVIDLIEKLGWENVNVDINVDLSSKLPDELITALIEVTGLGLLNQPICHRRLLFQTWALPSVRFMECMVRIATVFVHRIPFVESLQRRRVLRDYKANRHL